MRDAGCEERADTASRIPHPASLFEDATSQLGGHVHTEKYFDDWERQFLLPTALSQLGPGVAWFDYDRDGHEDLLIGTGRFGTTGVFHNDGRRLLPTAAAGAAARAAH